MKRMNFGVIKRTPLAVAVVLIGMAGCGPVIYDGGPDWDGGGIGWEAGYYGYDGYGRERDHDHGAFHHDGGDRAGARGHSSFGGRAGGGGGAHGGGGGGGHGGGGGGGGGHGGGGGGGHR